MSSCHRDGLLAWHLSSRFLFGMIRQYVDENPWSSTGRVRLMLKRAAAHSKVLSVVTEKKKAGGSWRRSVFAEERVCSLFPRPPDRRKQLELPSDLGHLEQAHRMDLAVHRSTVPRVCGQDLSLAADTHRSLTSTVLWARGIPIHLFFCGDQNSLFNIRVFNHVICGL